MKLDISINYCPSSSTDGILPHFHHDVDDDEDNEDDDDNNRSANYR